jgi:single-stranded-DNA-specific exonuclease
MEQFSAFKEAFRSYYAAHPPWAAASVLCTDFIVTDPALLSLDQVKSLDRLEPCGRGNPNPLLVLEGASLVRAQTIGGGKHLKLQAEKYGQIFDCTFFGMTSETLGAHVGDLVDLAFTPQCNHFRGKTTVQFLMRDLGLSERRLIRRAQAFCRSLLAGEQSSATLREAKLLHPERAHFVSLWRRLAQARESISGHVDQVLEHFTAALPALSPARTYVCLRVFGELGLAEVFEDADSLRITPSPQEEKVDLNASQILRTLQGVMDLESV